MQRKGMLRLAGALTYGRAGNWKFMVRDSNFYKVEFDGHETDSDFIYS
jgi:hypothetical protein